MGSMSDGLFCGCRFRTCDVVDELCREALTIEYVERVKRICGDKEVKMYVLKTLNEVSRDRTELESSNLRCN